MLIIMWQYSVFVYIRSCTQYILFDIICIYIYLLIFHGKLYFKIFGGVEHNSLAHLICGNQNIADNGVFDSIKQTKYIDDKDVEEVLNINENDFVILSLNCQSLSAKINSLKVLINQINNQHKLSAICLQETWLSSEYDTSLFEIEGYNLISAGKYNFENFNLHPQSMIWDDLEFCEM